MIAMAGLDFYFPLLRCFDIHISKLVVNYNRKANEHSDRLERYVIQYCADTLTSIPIESKASFSVANIQKPFKFVKCVSTYALSVSHLENALPSFLHCFPNVRELYTRWFRGTATGASLAKLEPVFN